MAWYNRLFNWVTDRDNGIPITASRMDAEFDGIATALNSLHSGAVSNEWLTEQTTVTWTTSSAFSVAGVNVTSTYHRGRRLKVVHNGGATTSYGVVTSSSFGTSTLVFLVFDNGAALVNPVTEVSYGLLSYTNPSYLDPRVATLATTSSAAAANTSATKVTLDNIIGPAFASSRFTSVGWGYYQISAQVTVNTTIAAGQAVAYIYKDGVARIVTSRAIEALIEESIIIPATVLSFAPGQYAELFFKCSVAATITSSGAAFGPYDTFMSIAQVP